MSNGGKMELFDSHAHYNDEKFNQDRDKIIQEILKENIKFVIAGYNLMSSKKAIEISNTYEKIFCTCGISPNDLDIDKVKILEQLNQIEKIAKNNKIVAIGEIGLDYYWNKENKDLQKEIFIKQIGIANRLQLPIVIHTRDAINDTIEILKNNTVKKGGIFHCCPLNKYLVEEALKLGFYISFSGVITFKNCKNAEEIINIVPEDKILIETDSPYLSPEPNRGKRNDSNNVKYVAEKIAKIKNKSIEEIAKITYDNTLRIFNKIN